MTSRTKTSVLVLVVCVVAVGWWRYHSLITKREANKNTLNSTNVDSATLAYLNVVNDRTLPAAARASEIARIPRDSLIPCLRNLCELYADENKSEVRKAMLDRIRELNPAPENCIRGIVNSRIRSLRSSESEGVNHSNIAVYPVERSEEDTILTQNSALTSEYVGLGTNAVDRLGLEVVNELRLQTACPDMARSIEMLSRRKERSGQDERMLERLKEVKEQTCSSH